MEEQWQQIFGYEGLYEISSHGRIKSLVNGIIMKTWKHYKGHEFVYLNNKGRKKFFVHRLVAVAFIPNPEGKPIVNHIDENKGNNHMTNLEWMTSGENTRYYFKMRKQELCINTLRQE